MNNNNDAITIKELIEVVLNNKLLFCISLLTTISFALIFISIEQPLFTSKTTIQIADTEKGRSIGNTLASEFENIGLNVEESNISNEINILSTFPIVSEVVKRLNLTESYNVKFKNIRWVDVYNATPINVILDTTTYFKDLSLVVLLNSEDNFKIEEFETNDDKYGSLIGQKFNFGESIKTPNGYIKVLKSDYFKPSDIGTKVKYTLSPNATIARSYISRLHITQRGSKTTIIDISLTDSNIAKAKDFLNMLVSVYSEKQMQFKNASIINTAQFISDRLNIIGEELETIDNNISLYKSSNEIPNITSLTQMQLNQIGNSETTQIELNNQLLMARYVKGYLGDINSNSNKLIPSNTGINSNSIESQISKYNNLVLKQRNLMESNSNNNPYIIDLNNELSATKEIIDISIDDLIANILLKIKNISDSELENRKRMANNPGKVKDLASIERQQTTKEKLYIYLLQKQEENSLAQSFASQNVRVLEYSYSTGKVSANKLILMIFAIIIGMAIPVIWLIIKTVLDTTVKRKKDLLDLNIPFIGEIPKLNDKIDKSKALTNDRSNVISEAYRVVRTNLDLFIGTNDGCKKIIITSLNPHSGKTMTSLNLASVLTMRNNKVLLIDADMRRATLSSILSVRNNNGLSNFLNESKNDVESLICNTSISDSLDILPAGVIPPNPSELLSNTSCFEQLIDFVSSKYDYIIVDTTPVLIVPDASISSKYCDYTIFVARAKLLDKRNLPDIQDIYISKQLNNMCILLNGVNKEDSYYKYGYYKR